MQRLTVEHKTIYRYKRPVKFGEHRLMLRPRESHDLRLLSSRLLIQPDANVRWMHDVFSNSVAIADILQPSDELCIENTFILDRYPSEDPTFCIDPYAQKLPFSYSAREVPDLGRNIERHHPDPDRHVIEWTRERLSLAGDMDTEDFLIGITRDIRNAFRYEVRQEPGVQTPVETLERGAGSCRDYALFMMEAVRSVGLAARFVSGYLYDSALDGVESNIAGAGSTHAWVQVYLPGAGWVEFDPTNGSHGGNNLIPVAVARDPSQAMPVSGTYDGDPNDFLEMEVVVEVHSMDIPAPMLVKPGNPG
ncbi:MAG: transglutaminase family protein [Nitrospirota bacterium]|nr:transglutaminase family protein [Nitrospirota bacterium]